MFNEGDRIIYVGGDPTVFPLAGLSGGDRGTVVRKVEGFQTMEVFEVQFDTLIPGTDAPVVQWIDVNYLVKGDS